MHDRAMQPRKPVSEQPNCGHTGVYQFFADFRSRSKDVLAEFHGTKSVDIRCSAEKFVKNQIVVFVDELEVGVISGSNVLMLPMAVLKD